MPDSFDPSMVQLAQFLGLHAQNAYQTGLDLRRALTAYDAVGLFQRNQGYLAGSGEQLVIAFAGPRSQTQEYSLEEYCRADSIVLAEHPCGRVHSGCHRQVQMQLKEEMLRGLEKLYTGQTVLLTGHSRGGALALLMAHELQQQGISQVAAVTFGTPRVGDRSFAESYELPVYRIECEGDPVPFLPPSDEYAPVGDTIRLGSDGTVQSRAALSDATASPHAQNGADRKESARASVDTTFSAEAKALHGIDCYLGRLQNASLQLADD